VRPGELAFDIGANVGNRVEPLVDAGARVVAVEPQAECSSYLERVFGRARGVIVVPSGVGATRGRAMLRVGDAHTLSTMSDEFIAQVQMTSRFGTHNWTDRYEVAVTTLDDLISEHGEPVFCKIDVEGYEAEVLRGLSKPLRSLSFEFMTELDDVYRACITHLDGLGSYEYNFSLGESMRMARAKWLRSDELLAELDELRSGVDWGDVYARRAEGVSRSENGALSAQDAAPRVLKRDVSGALRLELAHTLWARSPFARRTSHAAADQILSHYWDRAWRPGERPLVECGRELLRARAVYYETLPQRPLTAPTDLPLNVVVPVATTDAPVVERSVEALKRHILDRVDVITLVAVPAIAAKLKIATAQVLDEREVVSASDERLLERYTPPDRRGWYRQQIAKLRFASQQKGPTLCVDSDTLLMRPQRFLFAGRAVLFVSREYHTPYFDHLSRVLSDFRRPRFSTTSHQMLYYPEVLCQCLDEIAATTDRDDWVEGFLGTIDPSETSGSAECELYGQWTLQRTPERASVHRFSNRSVPRSVAASRTLEALFATYAEFDTISLHAYLD
jgi:FkbM family methyltransferase